jgi:CHAT domain-containing protein/tetratricopeptide (TPR) repeat protein
MAKISPLLLHAGQLLLTCCICLAARGQCPTNAVVWDSVIAIENSGRSMAARLEQVQGLQQLSDRCHLPKDSVYARILHRIGSLEYGLHNNIPTSTAIENTLESIRINTAGKAGGSPAFAVTSYTNLAIFYRALGVSSRALACVDSALAYGQRTGSNTLAIRVSKVLLFVQNGDYQKSIDESTIGLAQAREAGSVKLIQTFLNQRALSCLYQGQTRLSEADADAALSCDGKVHDDNEMATAYKTKALIRASQNQPPAADAFFGQAIRLRLKTADFGQIANDYIDLGNYYQNNLHDYARARTAYRTTLEYALRAHNNEIIAKAYTNLGAISFREGSFASSLALNTRALATLLGRHTIDSFAGPTSGGLESILNKDLLLTILVNRVDASIHLYRQNKNRVWLDLSLGTALLTDSLITILRHQQLGEQSKLYWRDKTREIFANALDACYFSNNPRLAFFFMEKSRAVILNDKLNELGAQALLSAHDAIIQRQMQVNVISRKLQALTTPPDSPEFAGRQLQSLHAQEEFEHYIHSLENKYPAYYQYKYADSVPSLPVLQAYLAGNKAAFLHFFTTDSVAFILRITSADASLVRLSKKEFDNDRVRDFLRQCSDLRQQNSAHAAFVALSHQLYNSLFQPLALPAGRVIICSDNFLLPFDILYKDTLGRQPLLNDYAFSYVYSARSLLNTANPRAAGGNFIGFAPVSFQPYLHLPELKRSAESLRVAAAHYQRSALYTNDDATRDNFLQKMPGYAVVNVFSHARADSDDNEPVLFMEDSMIRLSELQLLHSPSTQLVVLSACQTNAGKTASGEGIYSLARGFSSAGIPSVAATLWNADESAIYTISGKFHQYLSQGLPKDIALQKAKMEFIKNSDNEGSLPYYWANMIIIGNAEPVRLVVDNGHRWRAGGAALALIFALTCLWGYYYIRRKRRPA